MRSSKAFIWILCLVTFLNVGAYWWSKNIDQRLQPEEVAFLDGLPSYSIWGIAFDHTNRLWVYGSFGVNVYENNKLVYEFSNKEFPGFDDITLNYTIQRIYFDRSGRAWFVTDNDLHVFDNEKWETYSDEFLGTQDTVITAVAFDEENSVWIGTLSYRILILTDSNITGFKPQAMPFFTFYDITADKLGRIWISTWGSGVIRIDGKIEQVFNSQNYPLISDSVYTVSFDDMNSAWIATSDGVTVFDGSNWNSYSSENSPIQYYGVMSVNFSENGRVWFGDIVLEGEGWKYYFVPTNLFEDWWHEKVFDAEGNLWIRENAPFYWQSDDIFFVPANVRLISEIEGWMYFIVRSIGLLYLSLLVIGVWLLGTLNPKRMTWVVLITTLILAGLSFFYWIQQYPTVLVTGMISRAHIYFVGNPGVVASVVVLISGLTSRLFQHSPKVEMASIIIGIIVASLLGVFACITTLLSLMGP